MKIDHVNIHGLRALEQRDDALVGADGPWTSVCVRGPNGSGKTTWLEAVGQLWQWFRRCAKKRDWVQPSKDPRDGLLQEAQLVAAHFTGLPGPRPNLWLAWGEPATVASFVQEHRDTAIEVKGNRPRWDPDLLSWWDAEATRAELGQGSVPNMVLIGAEDKQVAPLRRNDLLSVEAGPAMRALYRYEPASRGSAHLEAVIGTLKLVDEARFHELERWVRDLFPGLEMAGFDERSRRPLFRLRSSETLLTLDRLSAGERSVLVNLVTVLRGLAPGGIVLLDEPELHMHLSLMRGTMAVLEQVVREMGGQLLVASHAPEVWNHFLPRGALVELSGRGARRG